MDKRYLKWYLLVGVLALIGSQLYMRPETRGLLSFSYWQSLFRYGAVLRLIESEYVDPDAMDYHSFTDAALNGGLMQFDPYASYYTEDAYMRFQEEAEQRYVGVGIEVGYFESKALITDVFAEGSAGEAGIQVGDRIVGVDEMEVSEDNLSVLIDAIRGQPGTEVSLKVERIGEEAPLQIRIERQSITLSSIADATMEMEAVGYVRVRQFTEKTDVELREAIKSLSADGMRGLIIDLRGNPGGRLDTAVQMAEFFLEPGKTILKVQSRRGIEEVFKSKDQSDRYEGALVLLIDERSASASEVFAGALRDHDRAVLVGETSFGKGSVQSVIGFSNGDGLKLTSARYLLPNGQVVQGVGVEPDIEIEIPEQAHMRQMLRRHLETQVDAATIEAFFGFELVPDAVLEAGKSALVELLKSE